MTQPRDVPPIGYLALRVVRSSPGSPFEAVPRDFPRDTAGLRAVKTVTFSLCTSSCTKVFTLSACTPLKKNVMLGAKPQSSGRKTTKTGGSHFFGFQPPKKFVGSLPPSPTGRDSCTVASTGENGEP
jgi:hypothetical protein